MKLLPLSSTGWRNERFLSKILDFDFCRRFDENIYERTWSGNDRDVEKWVGSAAH